MWTLELTVKHVPKIVKMCALRNSEIVFSRERGFIFQGFQHLQKLAKIPSKSVVTFVKTKVEHPI